MSESEHQMTETSGLDRIGHYTNMYTNSNAKNIVLRLSHDDIGQQSELPYVTHKDFILSDEKRWSSVLDLVGHFRRLSSEAKEIYVGVKEEGRIDPGILSNDVLVPGEVCGRTKQVLVPDSTGGYVNVTPLEGAGINLHIQSQCKDKTRKLPRVFDIRIGGEQPQNVSVICRGRKTQFGILYVMGYKKTNTTVKYQYSNFRLRPDKDHFNELCEFYDDLVNKEFPRQHTYNAHARKIDGLVKKIVRSFLEYHRMKFSETFTSSIPFNDEVLHSKNMSNGMIGELERQFKWNLDRRGITLGRVELSNLRDSIGGIEL